jgi:CRP-like cAMP-binding protein
MKNYYPLLKDVSMFKGIDEESFPEMLSYLDAYEKSYDKNDSILNAGDPVINVGIVLDGLIHIIKEDINGNRSIVAEFGKNHIFEEAFCCARLEKMPVSVTSASKSSIFLVNYGNIISEC